MGEISDVICLLRWQIGYQSICKSNHLQMTFYRQTLGLSNRRSGRDAHRTIVAPCQASPPVL